MREAAAVGKDQADVRDNKYNTSRPTTAGSDITVATVTATITGDASLLTLATPTTATMTTASATTTSLATTLAMTYSRDTYFAPAHGPDIGTAVAVGLAEEEPEDDEENNDDSRAHKLRQHLQQHHQQRQQISPQPSPIRTVIVHRDIDYEDELETELTERVRAQMMRRYAVHSPTFAAQLVASPLSMMGEGEEEEDGPRSPWPLRTLSQSHREKYRDGRLGPRRNSFPPSAAVDYYPPPPSYPPPYPPSLQKRRELEEDMDQLLVQQPNQQRVEGLLPSSPLPDTQARDTYRLAWLFTQGWRAQLTKSGDFVEKTRWGWFMGGFSGSISSDEGANGAPNISAGVSSVRTYTVGASASQPTSPDKPLPPLPPLDGLVRQPPRQSRQPAHPAYTTGSMSNLKRVSIVVAGEDLHRRSDNRRRAWDPQGPRSAVFLGGNPDWGTARMAAEMVWRERERVWQRQWQVWEEEERKRRRRERGGKIRKRKTVHWA